MSKKTILSPAFDEAKKLASKQINNIIEESYTNSELYKSAKNFIDIYQSYQKDIQIYTEQTTIIVNMLRKKKDYAKMDANTLSQKIEAAKAEASKAYSLINKQNKIQQKLIKVYESAKNFQKECNAILGTEIKLIFVAKTKTNTPQIFDISNLKLEQYTHLDRASFSRGGILKLRFDNLSVEKLNELGAKQITNNEYQKQIDSLYSEIMRRIDIAKEKSGGTYLMYKWSNEWNLVKINTLGDLDEAYANLVLNYHISDVKESWLGQGSMDEQIHYFMNYLWQVNNASGFLKEDIYGGQDPKSNKNIFYGVKSADASMMGLKQIYNFALIVYSKGENKNDSQLRSLAKTFGGTSGGQQRNKLITIQDTISKEIDKLEEETMEDILQALKLDK